MAKRHPVWPLQDAKARFSEVVRRAEEEGPQHVSLRGRPAVVVVSEQDYQALTGPRPSLVDFILDGEPWPADMAAAVNARPAEPDRDVAL